MKRVKRLALQGNVPELQKNAQFQLKGGFGVIGTKSIQSVFYNENCALRNTIDPENTYHNKNCDCVCDAGSY